jgi:hypothetical protein
VYLDLNLNLNLWSYPAPNSALFKELFREPNASSLTSEFISKLSQDLDLNLNLSLVQLQPPGRPPVRHPHGRFVVQDVPDHYM